MTRIESENKEWGFYGTFLKDRRPRFWKEENVSHPKTSNAFDRMARIVMECWKLREEQAQKFLDSRMGRHLCDSLSYFKGNDKRTFKRVLERSFGLSGRRYREFYNW